ncbi:hypothetical protein LSTR_LSTR004560 [Laodelphax striatellus]|uniref:Major facilitator superfamily (MFS) profile domain-containing protein n=1 Tax=Laodelphax striatellus TaxID=195883 RepID=A0A482WUB2_LAOST|nr:hypothetical protein LSTR_LSTR004560 [Laodelphax striatellus]
MPGVGKANFSTFEVENNANIVEREKTKRTRLYYAALTANLAFFSCGASLSWTSPTLPRLIKGHEPWLPVITSEIASLIASFLMLGAATGPVVAGLLLNNVGRKKTLITSAALHLLSWVGLGFAPSLEMIYLCRFIQGVAVAIAFTAVPMYVGEISERKLRAVLASSSEVFLAFGYMMEYAVGPYLSYTWLIVVSSIMPMLTFVLFFFVPESPHFLLQAGNKNKAMKDLRWLRGNVSVTAAKREIAMIQASIEQGLHTGQRSTFHDILSNPGSVRAMWLSCGLMFLQQFSGINVVLFYAQSIFDKAGNLPSEYCAMTVGAVQLVSASFTPALVKRFGFKTPMAVSALGMTIAHAILGFFFFFEERGNDMSAVYWLPVTCLMLYIHVYCIGYSVNPGFTEIVFCSLFWSLSKSLCDIGRPDLYPSDVTPRFGSKFDFIVVGAGSAGSVVAERLSEIEKWNVLLIEAGDNPTLASNIPGAAFNIEDEMYFNYFTEPEAGVCEGYKGKTCYWPRGKALGGSSSVNAMLYIRGNRRDYDSWEKLGCPGWSYKDVLPYFKKSENMTIDRLKNSSYHGTQGYLCVGEMYTDDYKEMLELLSASIKELGLKWVEDVNGESQMGFTMTAVTVCGGERSNVAKSYLWPAKKRNNLQVMKNAFVTKILFNRNKQVYGVQVSKNGRMYIIKSENEVIVSAGSINSPQLLMLSGIGPKDHLEKLGIESVQNLKVGENLEDHFIFYGLIFAFDTVSRSFPLKEKAFLYLTNRTSPLASIRSSTLIGFVNTKYNNSDWPDIQFHNLYFNQGDAFGIKSIFSKTGLDDDFTKIIVEQNKKRDLLVMMPIMLQPKGKGKLLLKNTNPFNSPELHTGYMREQADIDTMVRGIRFLKQFVTTNAMKRYNATLLNIKYEKCHNYTFDTDDYWICALSQVGGSIYHQVGTCKMGAASNPLAVVDPRLKVYGVKGLRVIDASVMPRVTSGNTNAPTIMIAEKGSDFIKADYNAKNHHIPYF